MTRRDPPAEGSEDTDVAETLVSKVSTPDENDSSFESVIAAYIDAHERGDASPPHEWIQRYPQHADPLRSFLANYQWMHAGDAVPERSLIGQCLDDFELRREIARGGMGVVYEAIQRSLKRPVAVKLISDGVLANDELRMRFRIEAEAAAVLSHPNILPIHAIGRCQGMDYFVMPLISGRSLQADVDERSGGFDDTTASTAVLDVLPLRDAIRYAVTMTRDIARGVAYAHRRGIIHRDLKPDNVLIDDDGCPKIVDFGLAKYHRDEPQLTHDGQVLGTPHYMSPEQARGESDVTAATDIYSLGGILFALLTGTPPHRGECVADVLSSVLADESPSLRLSWRGGMPRTSQLIDLENVIARAMACDRTDRYRSADDFADDLDRVLIGEPTLAGPDGMFQKMTRELTRDQHQASFANWGRALRHIGLVVFLCHVLMFVIQQWMTSETRAAMSSSAWTTAALAGYFVPRLLMLIGIGWVIHGARDGLWMPRGVAERPVWSIWLGYLATLTMINVFWGMGYFDHAAVMVLASVVSGFAFMAMAGHLWGGNVILGLMFFGVAFLCAVMPSVSALLLGTGWLFAMLVLGRRYGTIATTGNLC